MPSASGNRREHRRRGGKEKQQQPRIYRSRSRDTTLSEEVSVSPSKSIVAPSLPSRSTESYYTKSSSARSDVTLSVDDPSAVCSSMRMNPHDSKTTYQLRDGSMLEILNRANSAGKTVSLKLMSGEQIFLERSEKGHSLMMLDQKHRVVHAIGTDWKEPEGTFRA
ncbi:hypothetical protein PENTCL1PPCAC_801 [Pristionchus entomophagus]|uniref:Uncharacterized protein n=1 Tax=Pristionchus entomophagus TaxID=358040 RepID=A0AAV5S6Y1_9BILA|nr:hypothetical protein PENTCL1PPCAC_801 [Pristionchus entomophagus]